MSSALGGLLVTVVTLTVFGLALVCFSLRDFSRSRLEEICKRHDQLSQFGTILQNHERSLLLCELVLLLLLTTLAFAAANDPRFALLLPPAAWQWGTGVLWILRVIGTLSILALCWIVLPWSISRVRGESMLFHVWPILNTACRLAYPIWNMAIYLDRMIHRVFGMPEPDSDAAARILTEELLTVIDEGQREGVLQSNASTMIHRVVDLQTEDVAAIMTPRTDIVTITADTPLRTAMELMVASGYSRVPVIGNGVDDIVGILYARDLLTYATHASVDDRRTAAEIARDVLYVPESQGIDDLLESMRLRKVHMAVVVDEYSGVSGVVTLEDVLEEIVGDIEDEYDDEEQPLIKLRRDGYAEVDARLHIDDLNEEFDFKLPEDQEYDTIGGFLLDQFGRIPATGEHHRWEGLKLTVVEADERRVIRIRIDAEGVQAEPTTTDG